MNLLWPEAPPEELAPLLAQEGDRLEMGDTTIAYLHVQPRRPACWWTFGSAS